ncbi:MAG: branched-chain amino acid ABC transporter permease [Xanthobacteraceae bacterium]
MTTVAPSQPKSAPRKKGGISPLALVGHAIPWVAAIVFFFIAGGYLSFGTNVIIWILFAMSLDLVLGYAGVVTLGQSVYFGFGAYAAGVFSIHVSGDPVLGHIVAIVLSALFGLVTGALILHTTGVTFLMLTLAIVLVVYEYANKAKWLTGGDDGLQGMQVNPLFGTFEFNMFGQTAYVYAAVVLFIWFLIAWRVMHSPFGRSLDGIRQNPRRMRAIGTPVWWRLLAIYTLSAAMAGSAGALLAHSTRFVGLSSLSLLTSGIVTVMLILGGTHRLYGAFVGAIVYFVVQDWTAKISPYFWEFIVGLMLMATVLFLEGGLMDLGRVGRNLINRVRRRPGST